MTPHMVRMGGWLLPMAAVLSLLGTALQFMLPGPLGADGPPSTLVSIIDMLTGFLLIGGFLAVSQAHSKQLGFIGLLGIVLFCLAAFLFEVVLSIVAIVLGKHTGPEAPTLLVIAGTILQFLGCILFGIRILHTRVFPRTLGWVLIVVAGLVIVSFALPESASELVITGNSVLLFLACGWLGYLVATQITEAITPPGNPATEIE